MHPKLVGEWKSNRLNWFVPIWFDLVYNTRDESGVGTKFKCLIREI